MSENLRVVAIGEMAVSDNPQDILVAYGLGSCVAVCLYDPVQQVGGMLHALLPEAPDGSRPQNNPVKFVDQGVLLLINALVQSGAKRSRLAARLCGGAQMLAAPGFNDSLKIGERNILAAKVALQAVGVPIRAQATGGNIGRTAKLHIASGQVTVKVMGHDEQII